MTDQKEQAVQRQEAKTAITPGHKTSKKLVGRMADRYGVPAEALLGTLRDTYFRPARGEPDFTDHELAAALIICEHYDLNPFAREIHVARNKGALQVMPGIDGWNKIINRQPTYDGCEYDWVFDSDGEPVSCTCKLYDRQRTHPEVVTEYFTECRRDSKPWQEMPRRMLRHKARIQAARNAYGLSSVPGAMAQIVDEDDSGFAPTEPRKMSPPPRQQAREISAEVDEWARGQMTDTSAKMKT